jgi:hypothetical protein
VLVKRTVLLMLFLAMAPVIVAHAQTRPPPAAAQVAATQVVAGQELVGAAAYASVIQAYGLQNAATSTPAQRAQMAQAMADYFTNGAKATAVPTSGPAAQYFTNGAAAVGAPTSALPSYTMSQGTVVPYATPTATETATSAAIPAEAGTLPAPTVLDASPAAAAAPPSPPATTSAGDGGEPALVNPAPTTTVEPPQPPSPPTGQLAASMPEPPLTPVTTAANETTPAAQPANEAPQEEHPGGVMNAMPSEPVTTRVTTILVPMAAGIGFAGLLIALGLSIHPHVRRLRRR